MKLLFQQIFNENFYKMSTCPIIVRFYFWRLGFCKEMDTGNVHLNTHTHVWTQMHAYLNTIIRSWKILVFTCFFGNFELIFIKFVFLSPRMFNDSKIIILDKLSCIWLSYFDLNLEKNIIKSLAHILQILYERMPHIELIILVVSNGVLKSFWLAAGRWGFPHWGIILKGEKYPGFRTGLFTVRIHLKLLNSFF